MFSRVFMGNTYNIYQTHFKPYQLFFDKVGPFQRGETPSKLLNNAQQGFFMVFNHRRW